MYFLDTALLVKQLLPPHWRRLYREKLTQVLATPLKKTYEEFMAFRDSSGTEVGINIQVFFIDKIVREISGNKDAALFDLNNNRYEVYVQEDQNIRVRIKNILDRYRLVGTSYSFITII